MKSSDALCSSADSHMNVARFLLSSLKVLTREQYNCDLIIRYELSCDRPGVYDITVAFFV